MTLFYGVQANTIAIDILYVSNLPARSHSPCRIQRGAAVQVDQRATGARRGCRGAAHQGAAHAFSGTSEDWANLRQPISNQVMALRGAVVLVMKDSM